MATKSRLTSALRFVGRSLDGLRRGLHLVVLLLLFAFFIALIVPEPIVVPDSAALVVAPSGVLVDQLSGDPLERALGRLQGDAPPETLLKDVINAIQLAETDDRIRALYLQTDGLTGGGLSKLQELSAAIQSFKETGKPVLANGSAYGRDQYYLATNADEIFMHSLGYVLIEGYSRFVPYFKSALDSLYLDLEVWTAGEYKSFTEPLTRDNMSPEDREASRAYLDSLWQSYQTDITSRRGLTPDAMQRFADEYAELLTAADGNAARMAHDFGLVDALLSREEVDRRMIEIVGSAESQEDRFASIDHRSYLASFGDYDDASDADRKIAVLTLAGTISDGDQPPGSIGGDSAAAAIRSVTADDDVAALVLRVDSPGGSAFASDVILDALKFFQESERPLVVSMGSVAASGGYWISMSADSIWASPTTITGSIGVGAILPTVPRALDWAGVHVDGLGTTELAGQFSMLRGLGDDAREFYAQSVDSLYGRFVGAVAEHRERTTAEIDRVARGRVWSGRDAQRLGLVDELGDLADAVEAAAGLANLEPGSYAVDDIEPELEWPELLALELAGAAMPLLRALSIEPPWLAQVSGWVERAADPLRYLQQLNDPRGLYSYCFCDIR
jgi:protease-4